jgi:hypothetical protein
VGRAYPLEPFERLQYCRTGAAPRTGGRCHPPPRKLAALPLSHDSGRRGGWPEHSASTRLPVGEVIHGPPRCYDLLVRTREVATLPALRYSPPGAPLIAPTAGHFRRHTAVAVYCCDLATKAKIVQYPFERWRGRCTPETSGPTEPRQSWAKPAADASFRRRERLV